MSKTILITGAAKRIGKEIALTFCDLGWNIITNPVQADKHHFDE